MHYLGGVVSMSSQGLALGSDGMLMRNLARFVGASAHPQSAVAVFDRDTGYFRLPRDQKGLQEPDHVYEFNSLGFRGTEYEPAAALRVFVCGCSYAFGMGVSANRTWPVVFTHLAAAALGVAGEQSHVQNFSQVGASNNYVARTLIKQCDQISPTLAIAAFTHNSRVEYLDGKQIRNLGYWNIDPNNRFPEPPDAPGARFFRQYSERERFQNLLTNMVLFQSAMVNRRVPYIMVWIDIDRLHTAEVMSDPVLSDYYTVLDQSRISQLSIKQQYIHVDTVEGHPGPKSHERFATALVKEFGSRLLTHNRSNRRDYAAATEVFRQYASNGTSAARLTRTVIRAATRRRLSTVCLEFADTLAVEHFAGERAVELDLERRVWSIPTVQLRAAYADYITAELLRFNFWLSMLTAQEFLRARGIELQGSAPEHWFLEHGQGSPVLDELFDLLDRRVVSPRPTPTTASQPHALSRRLAEAKRRLGNSRIEAILRRVADLPKPPKRDDRNIYPLW
jgi:hypothetical protein